MITHWKKIALVALCALVYVVVKVYVVQTPDPSDDKLPDEMARTMLQLVS